MNHKPLSRPAKFWCNATLACLVALTASQARAGSQPQSLSFDLTPSVAVGNSTSLSATATSGLPVSFSSTTPAVCSTTGWMLTGLTTGTCTIRADQAGDATYAAAPQASVSITVGKAAQTISFLSAPALAVGGTGTLIATASSGLPVSLATTTPTVCTVSGSTLSGVAAGTCTITADAGGNASYAAAPQASLSVAVGLTPQRISFGAAPALSIGASAGISATASSGLPVTLSSLTPAVCSVAGSNASGIAAGLCTVAAGQAGNGSFGPAAQVTQSIVVSPASRSAQSISFGPAPSLAPGGSASLSASASSGLLVSFRSLTPDLCSVSGNTLTNLAAGTCSVAANQAGNATFAAAPEAVQNVTVAGFPGGSKVLAGNMFSDHVLMLLENGRVYAIGNNDNGQLGDGTNTDHTTDPVPVSNLSGVVAVAVGLRHSLAVKADGTVWAWGSNPTGQLGDGTHLNRSTPVPVPALSNITAVAGGIYHSLALKSDGTVWAWGEYEAALAGSGLSTSTDPTLPVQVPGLSQIVAISAGPMYSLALKSDGSVWAWGRCKDICGVNSVLLQVAGPGYTAISAGNNYFVALKADGTVWAQGKNNAGQLGDGSFTDHTASAVQVQGLSYPATAVVASLNRARAILFDGTQHTVGHWGGGDRQAIYEAAQTVPITPPAPGNVSDYIKNAVSISAGGVNGPNVGDYHWTLILSADGGVMAYSDNLFGNPGLSYGLPPADSITLGSSATDNPQNQPLTLTANLSNVTGHGYGGTVTFKDGSVTLGTAGVINGVAQLTLAGLSAGSHSLIASYSGDWQSGTVTSSTYYQLVSSDTPSADTAMPARLSAAATGNHALLLRSEGAVLAWGNNSAGQLGDGTTTSRSSGILVTGLGSSTAIAAGGSHSLALKSDGSVWAWGEGSRGELGNGTTGNQPLPAWATSLSGITAIAAGTRHSLALKSDGTVWAFGANNAGQLGNGSTSDALSPLAAGSLSGVTAVAAGDQFSLALKSDGSVWAWGANDAGQLGVAGGNSLVPLQISGLSQITAIAAGPDFALALTSDGSVLAWGANASGQLGDGTTVSRFAPALVQNLPMVVTALAAGRSHGLALLADGSVRAWGGNDQGQLGNGTLADTWLPAPVPLATGITAIAAGDRYSLSIQADGRLLSWGYNAYGQLGNGSQSGVAEIAGNGAPASSSVALSGSADTLAAGQALTLTATVTGSTPSGTVRFLDGASVIGSATVASGVANFTTSTLAVGTHALIANYDGDSGNGASASNAFSVAVGVPASTVSLSPSATSVTLGTAVTLTASVTGSAPSGFVTFMDGAANLGRYALSGASASLSVVLPVGSHSLSTVYAGDTSNRPGTSSVQSVSVAAPSPAVSLTPTSLSFAARTVGTTSSAQTLTLSNTGSGTLTITSIGASGDFGQSNGCGGSLAAGASCTISVSFTPSATGARAGTLTVTDNASGSPHTVSLSGTGNAVSYTLTVYRNGAGSVSSSPTGINCGATCSYAFAAGTSVTLSASPDSGNSLTGWGGACGGTGTCSLTLNADQAVSANFAPSSVPTGAVPASLVEGWNLVGNSTSGTLDVAATFGNAEKVFSVWKWHAGGGAGWSYYSPGQGDGGAAYAASQGYSVLGTVAPGEGFWVNAKTAFSVNLGSGAAVTTASLKDGSGPGGANVLPKGWSLVAIGDGTTPRAFANAISRSAPAAGKVAATALYTLWAWHAGDNFHSPGWAFYAPTPDNSNTLTDYLASKGYYNFSDLGKTLDPATGFWVSHP